MKCFHPVKRLISCYRSKQQLTQTTRIRFYSKVASNKKNIDHIPTIREFISQQNIDTQINDVEMEGILPPYMDKSVYNNQHKIVYFETYGCQMNVNDTELAWSVLKKQGYTRTDDLDKANIILLVTCAIREKAESKIWSRINGLKRLRSKNNGFPKIGLLGCMAERLKKKALEHEKSIDVIAGPDSYRDLPRLLADCTKNSTTAINVMLSVDETYAEIMPVRFNQESKTAFVSIMRGCDNMCSYCIVPFTRGRERSRPISSIIDEVKQLSDQGIRQVTVLGQNVNSYRDLSEQQFAVNATETNMSKGFKTIYKPKLGGLRFADLLEQISNVDKNMRIRFTSPHPKDFPDEVLHLINERSNICNQIHLPAQSGSTAVLHAMRRGHTREDYDKLVTHIRSIVPGVSLSTDMISGFCGETEDDHQQTLDLVNNVKYDYGFFFAYSMRNKTHAYHRMQDDVPQSVKLRRLNEVLAAYKLHLPRVRNKSIGEIQLILVESVSRKRADELTGRNDGNIKVIIPRHIKNDFNEEIKIGDYIAVKIKSSSSNVLMAEPLFKTNIVDFERNKSTDTIL